MFAASTVNPSLLSVNPSLTSVNALCLQHVIRYNLPGTPGTFVDVRCDSDVANMWYVRVCVCVCVCAFMCECVGVYM